MPVNAAPFFIVGSGRSGTTLLRVILASHSRISIPPETWFLLPLLRRLEPDRLLSSAQVDYAIRTITGHYRWPDMELSAQEFCRRARELARPSLRDVVELIYTATMERENKRRWGDKTPGYIEIVPRLARLFPGSRFIHLCRDGRDVTKSFQRTGWYGPWLSDNTSEWNRAFDCRKRWIQSEVDKAIMDIRYEDLVLDVERTVRDICTFLGEEFEPQMLAWQSRVDGLVPAREMAIHDKLRHLPGAADVDRWRREMTTREVFVCEAYIGERLAEAGYDRKFPNSLWAPVFRVTRWYCTVFAPVSNLLSRVLRAMRRRGLPQPADRREFPTRR